MELPLTSHLPVLPKTLIGEAEIDVLTPPQAWLTVTFFLEG